jgi:predicted ATPase/DNA-binding SARP family transcriptional activator
VEYGLLGPFRVLDDKGAEVQPAAPKVRTLLALLLLSRGQPVSADKIADTLWGEEPPRSAPNLVHGYVRDLRRKLGIQGISTITAGYRLDVPRDCVDAFRFEDLVQAHRYAEALALWRGVALLEWSEQPWARAIAMRLEEERLAALESRLTQDINAGLATLVIGEINELVVEHPLRERFRVLLIKALYATGRQAEALDAYAQARRYLVDEVGVEPGAELQAVEAAVLAQDATLVPAPPHPAAAPPLPATPLVGRERVLATLRHALTAARLVTVAGPGGVGKTRLAVELLAAPSSRARAVWFVELANVSDDADVAPTVARTLQLAESPGQEIDLICDYLSRGPGLLVLDTCEHVVEGAAELVAALLARCAHLQVVTTTREPLRMAGEQIIHLRGLDDAAASSVFVARARAVSPVAALDDDHVRNIVRKMDGLPLALELAAARIAFLSLEQLATGLGQPLDLLGGDVRSRDPRHVTMRAVIGWSYDLLDVSDREALAALSVFVGTFDREAACAVVGDGGSRAVDHLLGRSLLVRESDLAGQARYRLLDLVRHFAQEQATPAIVDRARHRHLEYHVTLAARLDSRIRTAEATVWAAVARGCTDDLRAAASYAIAGRAAPTGRLVADLYWPWFLDGNLTELRSWATAALGFESDPRIRARLLRVLASTALAQGDTAAAVDAAGHQLDLAKRLPDEELVALAHNLLGMAAWARGDYAAAGVQHRAALDHARRCGQRWTLALVTVLAGRSAHGAGHHDAGAALLRDAETQAETIGEPMVLGSALDYRARAELAAGRIAEAAALATRALAAYRSIGYQEGLASAGTLAGNLAVMVGDHQRADALLHQAIDVTRRLRHLGGTASVLEAMAVLNHARGDRQRAAANLDEARALRRRTGTAPSAVLRDQLDRVAQIIGPLDARGSQRLSGTELQREGSLDLKVAYQEGALVEPPSPEPTGDFGVALAGVARVAGRNDVVERVAPAT